LQQLPLVGLNASAQEWMDDNLRPSDSEAANQSVQTIVVHESVQEAAEDYQ
jgi:hypothetical protein